VPPVSTLIKCWARAGGAGHTAAMAMAVAINFEPMNISPRAIWRKVTARRRQVKPRQIAWPALAAWRMNAYGAAGETGPSEAGAIRENTKCLPVVPFD
jgi:hypothetical protein